MLSVLIFGVALVGQAAQVDRNCLDDNLVDRCADGVQATTRTKLGVVSIGDEAEAGAEIYRAFFVDGYGNDLPSVAFERRPGAGPMAVVYGFNGARMSAPVSSEVWKRIQSESVLADRRVEDGPGPTNPAGRPSPPPPICLHSWVQTVEMSNTWPERWRAVPVRTRTEDSCGGGLTTRFAHLLAELAVEAIAPCNVLDGSQQRNRVTLLGTCLSLKGDRLAAAELRNARLMFGPRLGADPTDVYVWQNALGTNGSPRLVWAGQEVVTERGRDRKVAEFLIARQAELPRLTFRQTTFEGVDARRARAEGMASYGAGDETWQASYRQTWIWDPSMSEWMLSEWIVEPFARAAATR